MVNEKLVPVPGGAETGFNDYAFVWEKDRIRWYINGELVRTADRCGGSAEPSVEDLPELVGYRHADVLAGQFAEPGEPLAMEVDRTAFTALGDACQFPELVACSLD